MFDEVVCEYPLPDGFEEFQDKGFQTKDLDNAMLVYVITTDGRLWRHQVIYEDHPTIREYSTLLERWLPARVPVREERIPILHHGDVDLYTSRFAGRRREKMGDAWASVPLHESVELSARFTDGVLSRIYTTEDQRGKYDGAEKEEEG